MVLRFPPIDQVQTKGNFGGTFTHGGDRGEIRGGEDRGNQGTVTHGIGQGAKPSFYPLRRVAVRRTWSTSPPRM